jgi:hypothetical protein
MSEPRCSYIRCAAGPNLHSDILVRREGDLVRILGHPDMHFTAQDATALAVEVNRLATEINQEILARP